MELITQLNFNHGTWSYDLNGVRGQLRNAAQYADDDRRYKWVTPTPGTEKERFVLIGDGNFTLVEEAGQGINLQAFYVVQKVGENSYYEVSVDSFSKELMLG